MGLSVRPNQIFCQLSYGVGPSLSFPSVKLGGLKEMTHIKTCPHPSTERSRYDSGENAGEAEDGDTHEKYSYQWSTASGTGGGPQARHSQLRVGGLLPRDAECDGRTRGTVTLTQPGPCGYLEKAGAGGWMGDPPQRQGRMDTAGLLARLMLSWEGFIRTRRVQPHPPPQG